MEIVSDEEVAAQVGALMVAVDAVAGEPGAFQGGEAASKKRLEEAPWRGRTKKRAPAARPPERPKATAKPRKRAKEADTEAPDGRYGSDDDDL